MREVRVALTLLLDGDHADDIDVVQDLTTILEGETIATFIEGGQENTVVIDSVDGVSVDQGERGSVSESERVFGELLVQWRRNEAALIAEYSNDFDADNAAADQSMDQWRKRFHAAMKEAD